MGTAAVVTAGRAGGGNRDRTGDLLHAMQALSQLSYTPNQGAKLYVNRPPWRSTLAGSEALAGDFRAQLEFLPLDLAVHHGFAVHRRGGHARGAVAAHLRARAFPLPAVCVRGLRAGSDFAVALRAGARHPGVGVRSR